jgi:EAL domain-containing protein (putative c-di-GMP-specific phosphodiesterase class I)
MSLDMLKIDRSFVSGVQAGSTDARLVQAMIDMSHAMELIVVAEGIENEQDLRVLHELGCDQAQGYHIARPMRAEELVKWAEHYQANALLSPDDSAQL